MPKKISQIQIARELGVSQSLVSIVLNGRKDGIAEQTYERIWRHALENGYSPKGMKLPDGHGQDRLKAVGYFLRAPLRLATKSNFFSHVAQGLFDYLREHQVNLVFLGSEVDVSVEELGTRAWQKKPLAGIVILGEVQPEFLASVRNLKTPLVYLSARSPGFCHSVNANEFQAAEQLVDHLYELGHRRFAYLGGESIKSRNNERLEGLRKALGRYAIELPDTAILSLDDAERQQGYKLAEELLQTPADRLPTAWICVNGVLARGVISRLHQAGIPIGEEISVAAFDNTRVCSEEHPGITSAHSIPEDLGREAGRILLNPELHEVDSLLDVVLPSKIFFRNSSGKCLEQGSEQIPATQPAR